MNGDNLVRFMKEIMNLQGVLELVRFIFMMVLSKKTVQHIKMAAIK